ncbi:MAG: AI-2E family transporter [Ardenticatenaceae bacterium]|nr:AI-2E family transporter [Ardenticatenaceae bacterium]
MSRSWSKTTRYFVLTLALAGFVWFLIAARGLIGPLAIAALLAYVLNPGVAFVNTRTKLPRRWVVLLVYLLSLAVLITLGIILAPVIAEQVGNLADELTLVQAQLEALASPVVIMGFEIPLNQVVTNFGVASANFISPDLILGVISSTSTNLAWILVILVTTFYLLQDWHILREWILNLAPDEYQTDVRRLYFEVQAVWNNYLRGQLVLMLIVGILSGVGLAIIGVPGAAALGLLAGILDAILSVGPVIAMLIAAAVAWVDGSTFFALSSTWVALLVVIVFGLIQMVENVWLRPRVIGQWVQLHPAVVFIAVMGSLALAGVLVTLIIIPVLSSAGVIGRYIYCKVLDIDPWPETVAHRALPEKV